MAARDEILLHDLSPSPEDFRGEVLKGLFLAQKALPARFLYDSTGSLLFERITQLGEYYLTRAERKILLEHRGAIADLVGPCAVILEYGPGSGEKLELVLQTLDRPLAYLPIDISKEQLIETARVFMRNYPGIVVRPVCADFCRVIEVSSVGSYQPLRKVAFFLGSTIGNFEPDHAVAFLKNVAATVGKGGALVVGVDLIKESSLLENAYNDALGVTSQFNLNLLTRINRELNADFELGLFQHRAFFNPTRSRIEMHIASRRAQRVHVSGFPVAFAEGETIHTENSYKYSIDTFHDLARQAGFSATAVWTDEFDFFSVHFLEVDV